MNVSGEDITPVDFAGDAAGVTGPGSLVRSMRVAVDPTRTCWDGVLWYGTAPMSFARAATFEAGRRVSSEPLWAPEQSKGSETRRLSAQAPQ